MKAKFTILELILFIINFCEFGRAAFIRYGKRLRTNLENGSKEIGPSDIVDIPTIYHDLVSITCLEKDRNMISVPVTLGWTKTSENSICPQSDWRHGC
jgi:hypothetical protein